MKQKGNAAVHCVIIGFANFDTENKIIFDYPDIMGDPEIINAININSYLANADDIILSSRTKPLNDIPKMNFGNMPLDGGNLLFTTEEKDAFIKQEPKAEKYFKPMLSAREFLNGGSRYCLWLKNIKPTELRSLPLVMERVQKVKEFRLKSVAISTQKHAETPSLFRDKNNPKTFILIPRVSSENREYIPMGFFSSKYIAGDTCQIIPNATLYEFGVLTSKMHMAWVKATCGRLKSDYRYSKDIVYNNYPWAKKVSSSQKKKVEAKALAVLGVRAKYPQSSLADLYHALTMPSDLRKAHNALDKAVDGCYRKTPFENEAVRLTFLFNLYKVYTSPMFGESKAGKVRVRK